jgi:flagellar basal body-associated protein FliL
MESEQPDQATNIVKSKDGTIALIILVVAVILVGILGIYLWKSSGKSDSRYGYLDLLRDL